MLNMIQKNSRLTNYAKTYFEGVINQFVLACRQGSKPARKPPPPLSPPSPNHPICVVGRQTSCRVVTTKIQTKPELAYTGKFMNIIIIPVHIGL